MQMTETARRQDGKWTHGRRVVSLTCRLALLAVLPSCAKIAPPPGGPPDAISPNLIGTRPDSIGIYPGFDGNVEFLFDETVNEGSMPNLGYGNGDLEKLVILSPTDEVPKVRWERSRIAVRPREGWKPNTVYRIELLPGVTDLRRNREMTGQVITFTTGAPLPTDSLSGLVVDWATRGPARQAAIELVLLPDSTTYRTQTDSAGKFSIAPLPHGTYLVRGIIDQNRNRRLDAREAWDSATSVPAPTAAAILWLAPRDTAPPRIQEITVRDSTAVEVQLSQFLDPFQAIDTSNVRLLLLPDSTPVEVRSFRPKPLDDSLIARAKTVADSLRADSIKRARPDTATHAPARPAQTPPPPAQQPPIRAVRGLRPVVPVDSTVFKLAQTRPALGDRLVLRPEHPFPAEARFAVKIVGVRNLNGASGTAVHGFQAPKPPPPPKVDSTKAVVDSTQPAKPDTTLPLPRRTRTRPQTPRP